MEEDLRGSLALLISCGLFRALLATEWCRLAPKRNGGLPLSLPLRLPPPIGEDREDAATDDERQEQADRHARAAVTWGNHASRRAAAADPSCPPAPVLVTPAFPSWETAAVWGVVTTGAPA